MKRICMVFLCLLLLSGCAANVQEYEFPSTTTSQPTQTAETPAQAGEKEFNIYPVPGGHTELFGAQGFEGVFLRDRAVKYYDVELQKHFSLCSQPNCTHTDENCPAFFGGDGEACYRVVGDQVYALTTDAERTELRLIRLCPMRDERVTLWSLTAKPDHMFEHLSVMLVGNRLLVQYIDYLQIDEWQENDLITEVTESPFGFFLDLETGTQWDFDRAAEKEGLWAETPRTIVLLGEKYALLNEPSYFAEKPVTLEEYLNSGGAEEEYVDYLMSIPTEGGGYYLYDILTGESTYAFSLDEAHFVSLYAYYDSTACYVRNDTVFRVDLDDGSVTELFQCENIAGIEQFDGRVFYTTWKTTDSGETQYSYYCYEPATGETLRLCEKNGPGSFFVHMETDTCFVGLTWEGKNLAIKKQDYYNGNYNAAWEVVADLSLMQMLQR